VESQSMGKPAVLRPNETAKISSAETSKKAGTAVERKGFELSRAGSDALLKVFALQTTMSNCASMATGAHKPRASTERAVCTSFLGLGSRNGKGVR
jgi:hypothetical protein